MHTFASHMFDTLGRSSHPSLSQGNWSLRRSAAVLTHWVNGPCQMHR